MARRKLPPCPFCGGKLLRFENLSASDDDGLHDGYQVHCRSCQANGPLMATKEQAVSRWAQCPRNEAGGPDDCAKVTPMRRTRARRPS